MDETILRWARCPACEKNTGRSSDDPDGDENFSFTCTNPRCGHKWEIPAKKLTSTEGGRFVERDDGLWFEDNTGFRDGPNCPGCWRERGFKTARVTPSMPCTFCEERKNARSRG